MIVKIVNSSLGLFKAGVPDSKITCLQAYKILKFNKRTNLINKV
jgi:hypothetical protein